MKDNTIALVLAFDDGDPVKKAEGGGKNKAPGSPFDSAMPILMMVGAFLVFYIIVIVPNKKKDEAQKKIISEAQRGDKITTVGGIVGKIDAIEGDIIVLKTGDTKIRLLKNSVRTIEGSQGKK
jgi:preprotein translocase subunit YajC